MTKLQKRGEWTAPKAAGFHVARGVYDVTDALAFKTEEKKLMDE